MGVCGGGRIWDEGNKCFSKPIVNVIAMSNVGLFQDLNTFDFYSLCLRLLHFSSWLITLLVTYYSYLCIFSLPWSKCQLDISRNSAVSVPCCILSTSNSPGHTGMGGAWAFGDFEVSQVIPLSNQNREFRDPARLLCYRVEPQTENESLFIHSIHSFILQHLPIIHTACQVLGIQR